MKSRIQRVNQLIKREISQIVLKEFDFPRNILVTITRVETTANLIESKIYVSVMPIEKFPEVFFELNKKIYGIQQELNKHLRMRPIPKIEFIEEKETKEAGRIEKILEEIKKEKY